MFTQYLENSLLEEDTSDNEHTIEKSDSDHEFMWFYLSFISQILMHEDHYR